MKKLSKLKLKDVTIMSDGEMKKIIGGGEGTSVSCRKSCSNDTLKMICDSGFCGETEGSLYCYSPDRPGDGMIPGTQQFCGGYSGGGHENNNPCGCFEFDYCCQQRCSSGSVTGC